MGANAQTSVPAFTSGQVLTAAQVTQINTGIPVFASSTERDAAFGGTGEKTLAEGQMAYLEDTNATQYYDGSSWAAVAGGKILQIVQTVKTDTFSTSSTSMVDITGLSVSITPSAATSKVLVLYNVAIGSSGANIAYSEIQLRRDSTDIYLGSGGTRNISGIFIPSSVDHVRPYAAQYLDSPATTSALTYKLQARITNASYITYINRQQSLDVRMPSSITAIEVSA